MDAYFILLAHDNSSGEVTLSRVVNETLRMVKARAEFKTPGAWLHGLDEAVSHEAPNLNYVKKCARGYGMGMDQRGPGVARRLIPDDGLAAAREFEKGLDAEDEERKAAWEREEAARKAAEESAR